MKLLNNCISSEEIPMTLKWTLDDMINLISRCEIKEMMRWYNNPVRRSNLALQWEGYFFAPYYNNLEEQKRIKKLLEEDKTFFPG